MRIGYSQSAVIVKHCMGLISGKRFSRLELSDGFEHIAFDVGRNLYSKDLVRYTSLHYYAQHELLPIGGDS
jgi:hypothetical protein